MNVFFQVQNAPGGRCARTAGSNTRSSRTPCPSPRGPGPSRTPSTERTSARTSPWPDTGSPTTSSRSPSTSRRRDRARRGQGPIRHHLDPELPPALDRFHALAGLRPIRRSSTPWASSISSSGTPPKPARSSNRPTGGNPGIGPLRPGLRPASLFAERIRRGPLDRPGVHERRAASTTSSSSWATPPAACGEYGEAVTFYKEYLAHFGTNIDVLNAIGECYFQLGNVPEALVAWERSLELNPNQETIRTAVKSLKDKK